jgi:hypothetical protein
MAVSPWFSSDLIGGAFFGIHLLLLGYLLHKSDYFPTVLGVLLVAASLGYVTESFGTFLFPEYAEIYVWGIAVPAMIGEFSLCVWLMLKGVKRLPSSGNVELNVSAANA